MSKEFVNLEKTMKLYIKSLDVGGLTDRDIDKLKDMKNLINDTIKWDKRIKREENIGLLKEAFGI
jgi:hypothetical protein|nr:MAG TPA: hypothetical protein [Bacteriophage sp.]